MARRGDAGRPNPPETASENDLKAANGRWAVRRVLGDAAGHTGALRGLDSAIANRMDVTAL